MAVYPNYPMLPQSPLGSFRDQYRGGTMAVNPADPANSDVDYFRSKFVTNRGYDNFKAYQGALQGQLAMDPFRFQPQVNASYDQFMANPALGGGYKQRADAAYGQMANPAYMKDLRQQAMGNTKYMRGLYDQVGDAHSTVLQQALAQRQAAMGDVTRQAAMQQGAQYNPAIARTALMQQAMMGQNMASQIAAARAQERQQALMNYAQARQGAQGAYNQALGQNFGAANQMFTGAQNAWGALNDIGLQGHAQATSAFNQNSNLAKQTR